ncbi:hypothetical protein SAMN04488000_108413, partial [Lentzea albida]
PQRWPPSQIAGVWGRAPGEARKATRPHAKAATRTSRELLLRQLIQNRLQIRSQHRHQKRSSNPMLLVHNKSGRHSISRNTPENIDKTTSRSIINGRIGQRPILHEVTRMILRSLLDVDSDHLGPRIEDLLHLRRLSPAGPAPRTPNVDHNGLPRVIRQPNGGTLLKEGLPLKPLQRLPLPRRIPDLDLPTRSNEVKVPAPDLGSVLPGGTPGDQQQQNQQPLHAPVTRGLVAPTGSE